MTRIHLAAVSRLAFVLVVVLGMCPPAPAQTPADSAFTYQGELRQGGQPVTLEADLRFRLFGSATGGTRIGPEIELPGHAISVGRFSASLDFGETVFNGEARWLEVDVRVPPGSGAYITLSPRQQVTASPFSLHTRGIVVDSAGNAAVDGTMTATRFIGQANGLTGTIPESTLPQNAIDSTEIQNESLTGADIANGSIGTADLQDSSVTHEKLLSSSVRSNNIATNSITTQHVLALNAAVVKPDNTSSEGTFGDRPIHVQRYGPFGTSGAFNTAVPADKWIACVVGMRAFNGDIQENGAGDILYAHPYRNGNFWAIAYDFRSHQTHEGWELWVMFINRGLATSRDF